MIAPIQITETIAADIATALQATDAEAEHRRCTNLHQLEQRRRMIVSKLDRGYDDFVSGTISNEF